MDRRTFFFQAFVAAVGTLFVGFRGAPTGGLVRPYNTPAEPEPEILMRRDWVMIRSRPMRRESMMVRSDDRFELEYRITLPDDSDLTDVLPGSFVIINGRRTYVQQRTNWIDARTGGRVSTELVLRA